MKVLITGSSGMLGSDLCRILSPHFDVYGISRHQSSAGGTHLRYDLTQTELIRTKVRAIQPDVIIHAAAFTKVDLCEDLAWQATAFTQNVDVTSRLIEIANEHNALFIFFSTDYVFSGDKRGEYVETDAIQPINYYGKTKAEAEAAIIQLSQRHRREFQWGNRSWVCDTPATSVCW